MKRKDRLNKSAIYAVLLSLAHFRRNQFSILHISYVKPLVIWNTLFKSEWGETTISESLRSPGTALLNTILTITKYMIIRKRALGNIAMLIRYELTIMGYLLTRALHERSRSPNVYDFLPSLQCCKA